MEIRWEHVHICAPDDFDTSFQFEDPREQDYWEAWGVVIETIVGASLHYTVEENQDVPEDDQVLYQMVVPLPVVFEEWHDEE